MQLPRERACVRECVTAAGVWQSSTNEWHEAQRAAASLMGFADARIQSTPPSKLQEQVSVPRCKK